MLNRSDQFVLEIDTEASFGAGGSFSGSELLARVWDVDLGGAAAESIEDQAYREEAGSPGSYPGLARARAGGVTFKHYLEGLGTNGGAGTPSETALSMLLELIHQYPADAHDGSSVDVYTSTTAFTEADDDAHLPGTSSGLGLALIELDSGASVWRPYTYTALTDAFTLLMALPSATSNGKRVWRDLTYEWTAQPAATESHAVRFVGHSDEDHAELAGVVCQGKISSTEPGTLPVLECELLAASYTDDYADTQVAASNAYGAVMAGGNVAISGYGSSVVSTYRATSVEVDLRGAFTAINDPNRDDGTAGFTRAPEPPTVTIQIPLTDDAPAALTATTWREARDNNLVSGNDVQIIIGYGATPGRQVGCYWSRARLVDWARSDNGGLAYQTLTFGLVPGGTFLMTQG